MAHIFNCEWDSLYVFDEQMMEIPHYRMHPEMLPYIGRHYQKTGILLLGESHYLDKNETDEAKRLQDWYSRSVQEYGFLHPDNVNTRKVVKNYLRRRRSKAHSMFANPAKALISEWNLKDVNDSEAFTAFAFFNYFQRPATDSGKSISETEEDNQKAVSVLNRVVEIIKPTKVIFLSKKAYDSYCGHVSNVDKKMFDYVYHPTCKYWNSDGGYKKLCDIFSTIETFEGFSHNGHMDYERAKEICSKTPFRRLQKKQRRFYENEITYSIIADDNRSVGEIAWYLVEYGARYSMGYVVQTRTIWVWDYQTEWYIDEIEGEKHPKLAELYQAMIRLIGKL